MNKWKHLIQAVDDLSLRTDARVLVATSGGSDSVALALAFHFASMRPGYEWKLRLGHVNHCLRGSDSADDEAFVLYLGRRLHLSVDTVRIETSRYAAEHRLSLETAARELRYRELDRMLRTWGGDVIAVAHHADDQAETVLMNLVRGAGLDGLTGMSSRAGTIVRPFLQLSKASITAALEERGESHRFDRSNDDLTPRRNFFRHRVLSVLAEIRPDVGTALARTANSLRADADYLNDEASRALTRLDLRVEGQDVWGSTGAFRALQAPVQARVLRSLVELITGDRRDLPEEHVLLMSDTICGGKRSRTLGTQLPHALRLEAKPHQFRLYRGKPDAPRIDDPVALLIPGVTETALGFFEATLEERDIGHDHLLEQTVCGPNHALCDADSLGQTLIVRSRRAGDRIHLRHGPGSKKLQDLFVDAKIPRTQRDRIPVVENADFIAWIPGFGVDHRAALRPETERVAHLRFRAFI